MATGTTPDGYALRLQALHLALEFERSRASGSHTHVLDVARAFEGYLNPKPVPTQVSIVFDPPTEPLERILHNMASLNDGQQIVAHIDEVDAHGNPTTEPGTWTVDKPELLTVEVAADGMSATFTATGKVGSAVVSLQVGSLPVSTAAVDVVPAGAASVNLTFDAPTDVVPVTPPAQGL